MTAFVLQFQLFFAGLWPLIWKFALVGGLGVLSLGLGLALPLLVMLPFVGTFLANLLKPIRSQLIIAGLVILACVMYSGKLVHDEALRCKAKTEVIQKKVDELVRETKPDYNAPEHHMNDPWDRPDY